MTIPPHHAPLLTLLVFMVSIYSPPARAQAQPAATPMPIANVLTNCTDGASGTVHTSPIYTESCNGPTLLADGGFSRAGTATHAQCRVVCRPGLPRPLRVTYVLTGCGACARDAQSLAHLYLTPANATRDFHEQDGLYSQVDNVCIPRGVCIDQCGPEQDGCVYSGNCEARLCFTDRETDAPATLRTATFRGPGSQMIIDGGAFVPPTGTRADMDMLSKGVDVCGNVTLPVGRDGAHDEDQPLLAVPDASARKEPHAQCRVLNLAFARGGAGTLSEDFEIVRNLTQCAFCETEAGSAYVQTGPEAKGSNKTVCIPRAQCVAACGAEPSGCVYTGSCRSLMCFSGRVSRRPALTPFGTDDGKLFGMVVNDTTDASEFSDPPVFAPREVEPLVDRPETEWDDVVARAPQCGKEGPETPSYAVQEGGGGGAGGP